MSRQFVVITKDGSRWLRPVNPFDENGQAWRGFQSSNPDIPYIGNHSEGTILDESEVTAITQARHKESSSLTWFNVYDNGNWGYYETRIAYTDAESHDRHISDDYWKIRAKAAEKLIGISPSDPKTYDEFCRIREEWEQIVKQEPK